MRFSTLLPMLLAAGIAEAQAGKGKGNGGNNQAAQQQQQQQQQQAAAAAAQNGQNNNNNNNNNNANANAALALNPKNVQANSNSDGLAQAEAGQAASAKDPANFINFCTGKTLTNGLQVKGGSCNGIPMGDIPASTNMVSAVMINPKNGDNVQANQAINFQVQIANLVAGTFTNPDVTYYSAPQGLQGGKVVGHTHVTVQDTGNDLNPTKPLDAQTFAFFKGINDAGNGNGLLSANLAAGLPAGNYRVCTMTSSSNHQMVLMPVAQRGAQDDCVRFTVGGNNNNANANAGNANANAGNGKANAGAAAAAQGQNNNANGKGGNAAAAQGQGKAAAGQGQGKAAGGAKGRGRFGRRNLKFASRDFIA